MLLKNVHFLRLLKYAHVEDWIVEVPDEGSAVIVANLVSQIVYVNNNNTDNNNR